MLSPRRWSREPPLSSVTSCVRRGLCSRRHSLWILLLLVLVCIAFQTFVTRSAGTDKLTGPGPGPGPGPGHLRSTISQQQLSPVVWDLSQNTSPDQTSPDQASPDQASPDQASPDQTSPDQTSPDQMSPDQTSPDQRSPDQTSPDQTSPDQTSPDPPDAQQHPSDNGVKDQILNPETGSDLEGRPGPDPLVLHGTRTPVTAGPEPGLVQRPSASRVRPTASCRPKSHIVFLKTHKTASSTILNILYRYGESRNLSFALPVNRHSQLFYPFLFTSHFVEGVARRGAAAAAFHIMCNHMRFRKSEVAKVMPADTFYFSILRNPVAMMESIFIYYKSIPAFHKTRSLDDFLDAGRRGYNASAANNHYAHNILAFDFGLDNDVAAGDGDLEARAGRAVAAIERDFQLVLISEYFDESMVLLRHALCWSLDDVVSFKLNSRSDKTRRALAPDTPEKIRSWNALDWRIYLHFNASFWRQAERLVGPDRMRREVSELRELRVRLADTCLKGGAAVDPSQIKDAGLKPFQYGAAVIQGYNLNQDLDPETRTRCQRLVTPELQYTERLYTRQFPELAARLKRTARHAPPAQRPRPGRTAVGAGSGPGGPPQTGAQTRSLRPPGPAGAAAAAHARRQQDGRVLTERRR